MKRLLLLFISLFAFYFISSSQTIDESLIEVGVIEHLGDTLPLELQFLDENNDTVSLDELVDKPTVFSFVYFDCPGLCSPLLEGVSDVVSKTDLQLGTDYQVITISFNTTDTPEKAKEKKENFVQRISQESRKDWIYLTGWQENIDKITAATGYKYKPQGLDFAHPSVIILVSPEGKITRYLYGLTYLPLDFKLAVIEAQEGLERPTINRVLQYCFSYDPEGQGYTLQVTRITGTIILFIAVIIFLTLILRKRKNRNPK